MGAAAMGPREAGPSMAADGRLALAWDSCQENWGDIEGFTFLRDSDRYAAAIPPEPTGRAIPAGRRMDRQAAGHAKKRLHYGAFA